MSVGLIVVGDFAGNRAWDERHGPDLALALGLEGRHLHPSTLDPPRVLIVAVVEPFHESVRHLLGMLRRAHSIVLLIQYEATDDPELRDVQEMERDELCALLGNVVHVEPWDGLDDIDAFDAAFRYARTVSFAPRPTRPAIEFEPVWQFGDWTRWAPSQWHAPTDATVARSLVFTVDGPALRTPGGVLDLATGNLSGNDAPPSLDGWSLDGKRAWGRGSGTAGKKPKPNWRWGDTELPATKYGRPINLDPLGRAAWAGGRCRFTWWLPTPEGPLPWVANDHNWPCGHAKKLWGYENNDPLRVELAFDATVTLSHYEHDTLLSPGLPLRWHQFGALQVAVGAPSTPRALIYRHDPEWIHGDPSDAFEEDGRSTNPVVALGPNDERRYAVDLRFEIWRVVGEEASRLPSGGWGLFDAAHELVYQGPERLLGGSSGYLLLQDGEELVRLTPNGDRVPLGRVNGQVAATVPIVRTPGVVLIDERDGWIWVRLV